MPLPQRTSIVLYTGGLMLIITLAALQAAGWSEEAVRIVVRMSAKVAVVLFSLTFSASALVSLFPSSATKELLRNRRYLGLSFALAHTTHLMGLATLALAFPEPFVSELEIPRLIPGGLAYVFLFALALTSNDAAVAKLGRANWRRLHLTGCWVIEIIFAASYVPRAFEDPAYVWLAFFPVAVPTLRFTRWWRQRK